MIYDDDDDDDDGGDAEQPGQYPALLSQHMQAADQQCTTERKCQERSDLDLRVFKIARYPNAVTAVIQCQSPAKKTQVSEETKLRCCSQT